MPEKKRHESLTRLLAVAADAGVSGPAALAAVLGEFEQTINNWGHRGVSKAGAVKAQAEFGCDANWVLHGTGVRMIASAGSKTEDISGLSPAAIKMAKLFDVMTDRSTDQEFLRAAQDAACQAINGLSIKTQARPNGRRGQAETAKKLPA